MRSPFLWFADFYAEYSLRLGKTSLNFNVNIDNLFNVDTTTAYYKYRDYGGFWVSDEELLANQWDLEDRPDYIPNAMFKMAATFFPRSPGAWG